MWGRGRRTTPYGDKPAADETETEFFQMSEGDSVGETVFIYWARPVLMMELKVQARVERHTGVGYELVQVLDVPVLHGLEVADDINDRATLQLLRGLALVPQERANMGSSRHMNECCNGVNKLASCMGWWNRWWMFPHTCLRNPSWPSTSLRISSCLRRSMWMTAAT